MDSRGPSVALGERWVNLPHGYYLPELADRLKLLVSLPTGKLPHLDLMVADHWVKSPHACELTIEVRRSGEATEREVMSLGRLANVWRCYCVGSGDELVASLSFAGRARLEMRFEVSQPSSDEVRLTLHGALCSRRKLN